MKSYVLYGVMINATLIDGITRQNIGAGIQKVKNFNDGSVDVRYIATMSRKTTIEFSTRAVAKALGAVGARGAALAGAGVTLFFQKNADSGERASGTAHLKVVIATGLIIPLTLRAGQDGEGEISYQIIPVSADGTTDPITITDSQALAGTPDSAEKFTVGPCSINGTDVEPQSLEVNFGISVQTRSHSGFYLPLQASIKTVAPTVTIQSKDVSKVVTFALAGTAQSVTDTVLYLRKLDQNGTRVANITAEHVKLTIDDGQIHTDGLGSDGEEDATATLMMDVAYDGVNSPIVVAAASEIT